jgi:hypothetical protein
MIKPFRILYACVALAFCAGLAGCNSSTNPPTAEYVAHTTLANSNLAVDLASQAFSTLFVSKNNENEYSKFSAPTEYATEKARLDALKVQFNTSLKTYYTARDAAVVAAIAAKRAGTPMETPSMAAAAVSIAQIVSALQGGSK